MTTQLTTLPLSSSERNDLNRLSLLLDEFRKIDPGMPVQQMKTLVTVALEQGLTVTEIAQRAGLVLASASRHVEVLGDGRPDKPGHELMANDYDAYNRRKKIVTLTAKGARVVRSLMHYMRPNT